METTYYHGTNGKGAKSIIDSGAFGVDYFDGSGFYLTKDLEDALNHGHFVFVFTQIDESRLSTDDVNDGYLYSGRLPISSSDYVICDFNEDVVRELFQLMSDEYAQEDTINQN